MTSGNGRGLAISGAGAADPTYDYGKGFVRKCPRHWTVDRSRILRPFQDNPKNCAASISGLCRPSPHPARTVAFSGIPLQRLDAIPPLGRQKASFAPSGPSHGCKRSIPPSVAAASSVVTGIPRSHPSLGRGALRVSAEKRGARGAIPHSNALCSDDLRQNSWIGSIRRHARSNLTPRKNLGLPARRTSESVAGIPRPFVL